MTFEDVEVDDAIEADPEIEKTEEDIEEALEMAYICGDDEEIKRLLAL